MSNFQAAVDYIANTTFPYIIICLLLFTKFSALDWEPYIILGLVFFSKKYSFKVGYYSSIIENKGVKYEEKPKMEE
jgi:hypothetical protein